MGSAESGGTRFRVRGSAERSLGPLRLSERTLRDPPVRGVGGNEIWSFPPILASCPYMSSETKSGPLRNEIRYNTDTFATGKISMFWALLMVPGRSKSHPEVCFRCLRSRQLKFNHSGSQNDFLDNFGVFTILFRNLCLFWTQNRTAVISNKAVRTPSHSGEKNRRQIEKSTSKILSLQNIFSHF